MFIKVTMKNGDVVEVSDNNGGHGAYVSVKYEGAFVVVTDSCGKQTAYPTIDVKEVVSEPRRSW